MGKGIFMSEPQQTSQQVDQKTTDKELNFRALEAKYQKQLEQERTARLEAERMAQEYAKFKHKESMDDEDEDDEPYIDKKRLKKTLNKFGEQSKEYTQTEIQKAVSNALQEERKQNWLNGNKDFFDVLKHAEKLYQKDQELAEAILEMPDNFERQKLVYKNIKALGLHMPEEKKTIQEKVDANRKNPYYQPSGVGTAPYQSQGDFSSSGQKQAYQKMQELKHRLGIS